MSLKSGKDRKEMSGFDLLMLGNELNALVGGRIQKVFQKGKQIRIEIFVSGAGTKELFFEPGKLFLTKYKREASNEMFSQYLRKRLSGQRIASIRQIGFDRILEIETESNMLVLELFSKGNAVFCDKARTIMMPLEAQTWKSRKIAAKMQYHYPPPVSNPFEMEFPEFEQAVLKSEKGIAAFLAAEMSMSGKYAEEVCARAKMDKSKKCSDIGASNAEKLFEAIQSLPKESKPNTILESGKPADFAPIEMEIYRGAEKKYFPAFSEALDEFFANMEKETEAAEVSESGGRHSRIMETQKSAVLKWAAAEEENRAKGNAVGNSIGSAQELIGAINEAKARKKSWYQVKSALEGKSFGSLKVSEIRENEGVVIVGGMEIDFRKSARENANDYFEKAKRARRKREAAEKALEKAEAEMKAAIEKGRDKPAGKRVALKKRKEQKYYEKFRWLFARGGFLVIGGRDATQNEMIFKKHIDRDDIVLHADVHGAPLTVVKSEGVKISEEAITEAAEFAASYSSAWKRRLGSADVYWITPEQVSKTPPAGMSLAKGGFMIYGKKNYVRNVRLEIAIGIKFEQDAEGSKFAYPVCGTAEGISARAKYFVKIVPGALQHGELIKLIKKELAKRAAPDERLIIEDISADEFEKFLPAGGGELAD